MRNYQKELEQIIKENGEKGIVPTLLLHSCCAPCSSHCLSYLASHFKITVFYYNPNIYPEEEYFHRVAEQKRLIEEIEAEYPVSFVEGNFDPREFYDAVKGLEHLCEGGERCFACYRLRLQKTAELAKERGFDYFTTTLSISPLKNAAKLGEISESLGKELDIKALPSDFKKKDGYKKSIELSKKYGLYRQNYCGCVFSKKENEERQRLKEEQL